MRARAPAQRESKGAARAAGAAPAAPAPGRRPSDSHGPGAGHPKAGPNGRPAWVRPWRSARAGHAGVVAVPCRSELPKYQGVRRCAGAICLLQHARPRLRARKYWWGLQRARARYAASPIGDRHNGTDQCLEGISAVPVTVHARLPPPHRHAAPSRRSLASGDRRPVAYCDGCGQRPTH